MRRDPGGAGDVRIGEARGGTECARSRAWAQTRATRGRVRARTRRASRDVEFELAARRSDRVVRVDGIPARARALFDQQLAEGGLNRALGMLEVVRQIAPADPSLLPMSERLANAFLDLAETRIGEKLPADAERALQSARKLSPANPRLSPIETKLRGLATPAAG